MKKEKYYTIKVRIPCVVYKDVYVEASTQAEAKKITRGWLNGEDGADPYDCSGDYDEGQMYHKGVIESIIQKEVA